MDGIEELKRLVDWLGDPERQNTLMWIGGGIVVVAGAVWGAFRRKPVAPANSTGNRIDIKGKNTGVVIGGDSNGEITVGKPRKDAP